VRVLLVSPQTQKKNVASNRTSCIARTDQRTLLLFVIRDHIGTTPLVNLANTLEQDLIRIWDSLSKPPGLENCKLSDFFDLSFTGLPHKILVPEKFDAEVAQLRKRFVQKEHPDYIFKPAYHKRIPADGVALYMENIWVRVLFLDQMSSARG
jgi:protein SEY1